MGIFRTDGRIRREAARWIARLGAGADEEQHVVFRGWYRADPRHAEAYDRLAAIWSAAGRIPAVPTTAQADEKRVGSRRGVLRYAVAASFVAALAAGLAVLFGGHVVRQSPDSEPLSFASAPGQIRDVTLPDGSRLILDAGTRIDVLFGATERRLTLREGRARFAVAHELRPFIVSAASNEVVATGTLFDVSLMNNRVAVTLIEGSVEVRPSQGGHGGDRQRLVAGQKLVFVGQAPAVPERISRSDTLWPSQMLQFDETPLRDAVAQINRDSRIHLLLADEHIGSLRVSGAYRTGDVTGFARSLAAAFNLRLETLPDGNLRLADPRSAPR